MSVLFMFPGQGAQSPGMLHRLPDHPEVTRTFEQARAVLGDDPRALDSEEALGATESVQLSLLLAGVATARLLIAEGCAPDMVAGMSVGAYPAAVIAGALEFEDALRLVALRGRLMHLAFPAGYGMTAIIGLPLARLEEIVAGVHSPACPVHIANQNSETQIIVAGAHGAMDEVAIRAQALGATRCERLAVSVPSHCELLAPVASELRKAIGGIHLTRPQRTFISSSAARAMANPVRISEDLANNVARRVNWHDTATLAWELGARLAVEMPSGETLSGLTQVAFADGLVLNWETSRVDTLCQRIRREEALR